MSEVTRLLNKAFEDWTITAKQYVVGRIQEDFLSGRYLGTVTGLGKASLHKHSTATPKSHRFTIRTRLAYMVYWHEGMPPEITAKNAKALRFKIGGDVFYRKSVMVQRPLKRPFITDALPKTEPHVNRMLDNLLKRAIDQWPSTTIRIEI